VFRALPAAAALALLVLTGCSGSDDDAPPEPPAESAFLEGTCRMAAPDVIAIGRALPRLGDGGEVDQAVKDELRIAQDGVFALVETAEEPYMPALDELVVSVGIVRIRADGNSYEPDLGGLLRRSYDRVLSVCTAPN